MSIKRPLLVLAGMVLVGAGIVIYLLFGQPAEETGTAPPTGMHRTEAPAGIKQLETAFNSSDIAAQSKALAPGLDEQYRRLGHNPFAPGVTIAFDYTSYRQGDGCAKIEARLSTGENYLVHLVKQNNQWFIWHTEKGHSEDGSC